MFLFPIALAEDHPASAGRGPLGAATGPVEPGTANWPGWRGDGSGVSTEKNLPVYWSAQDNVVWATPLPGEGNSSPIVWGERVFLTASTDRGQKRLVLCLSAKDGGILWQTKLDAGKPAQTHVKNGYASCTPVCDGQRVYAFFDSPGLVGLDFNGTPLWTRPLGPFQAVWNLAASPILCKDLVVMNCDHDGQSFIVAVDRATGQEKWRTLRTAKSQYATPILIEHKGLSQIVVNGELIVSYDAAGGQELWTCRGMKKAPDVVVPTPLYRNGLVYFTCGRNGPTMAVDPGGAGDVTDTHMRMYVPTGGSYVPSPLFYPTLLLPNDDGLLRFLDEKGKAIVTHKLAGRFTSSPVGAEGRMYWAAENGDTFVVDVSQAAQGSVRFLGVNHLGESCLASPAVAGGRIYIRTSKHLFCIGNLGAKRPSQAPPAVKGTFAELQKQYTDNYPPKGNSTAARLAIIEAMGQSNDPDAASFLLNVVQQDFDWDANEAAAKALARLGGASEKQMIELLAFPRSHLQIIAADHLGRLGSADAVEGLVKLRGAEDSDEFVRLVCIRALGAIAKAHAPLVPTIMPVIAGGLRDGEGIVRQAALDAAAALSSGIREGDATFKALMDCAADRNAEISAKAAGLVTAVSKSAGELLQRNRVLYGEHRKDSVTEDLTAGAIRLKFQDGQLRYLRVGPREIVRRIYFAVRDPGWDTVMPTFSRMDVVKQADSFHVAFTALCKSGPIDYSFSGEIEGTAEGRITFRANGVANASFRSPRIGLCVLYGSSLAGVEFQTTDAGGKVAAGKFPRDISRPLLADNFQALKYAAGDMTVRCSLEGGTFSMEDQRQYGDSSYKAYGPIPCAYPAIDAGAAGSEVLTLQVAGAKPQAPVDGPVRIVVGQPLKGAKMPRLLGHDEKPPGDAVTMNYTPALHLFDDDALMENPPAVADMVRLRRKEAHAPPGAAFVIWPATIEPPYPRAQRDPRNNGLIAAAWSACFLKCAAVAGVDAVKFDVGPSYAATVQSSLGSLGGCTVLETQVQAAEPSPVDALAMDNKGRKVVYLVNKTDRSQQAALAGLEGQCEIWRLNESTESTVAQPFHVLSQAGKPVLPCCFPQLQLKPFEVCRISERAPAIATPKELKLLVSESSVMKLVLVPPGKFVMGDPDGLINSDGSTGEGPRHEVTLARPFYVGVYGVTQEQYEAIAGQNPSRFKGAGNPVDQVSWYEAVAFCEKLSAKTGVLVRLPTESEREYACRAGATTRYYFGDDIPPLGQYAWYGGNSGLTSHPVGQKKPNPFGLYDMLGNMWEWCSDRYMDSYADAGDIDPQGPVAGTRRVLRGGAYYHQTEGNSCADRVGRFAAYKPPYFGFRVVVSADTNGNPLSYSPRPNAGLTSKPATMPAASRPATLPIARQLPKDLTIRLGDSASIELVLIPAGKFRMGSPKDEKDRSWKEESPQHEVTIIAPFYMGVCEVAQQQYEAVMGTNPSKFKGPANPVECVSWQDALEFCRRVSKQSNRTVRLPTEAQWEYACRAGSTTRYYFGVADNDLDQYAWHFRNSQLKSHPVGRKQPNAFGLRDMHGNVWEWCQDWFADSYDGADPVDPQGPDSGTDRVIRGGGWNSRAEANANSCRSAQRDGCPPAARAGYIGFRIVVEAE